MIRVVLECPVCRHQVTQAQAILVRRIAMQQLEALGAELVGPFCVECKRAGRPDSALAEKQIDDGRTVTP